MAEFTPGKPVRSSEPAVRVDTLLASGRYRFRLVVLDNDRNASAPAELIVSIVKDAVVAPPTHTNHSSHTNHPGHADRAAHAFDASCAGGRARAKKTPSAAVTEGRARREAPHATAAEILTRGECNGQRSIRSRRSDRDHAAAGTRELCDRSASRRGGFPRRTDLSPRPARARAQVHRGIWNGCRPARGPPGSRRRRARTCASSQAWRSTATAD